MFIHHEYGKNRLSPRQILTDPILFLAFGFGSGLAKKAPGTFGTLAALPVYVVLAQTGTIVYGAAAIVAMIVGILICGIAAEKLGEHDFGGIVWDEVAGYLVTMWLIPFNWQGVIAGFALFRLFDIVKPWPIRWFDRHVHGGLGIMLDDIVAGIFANAMLHIWLAYAA
jgi:phosphatidylglycerophosphatase A